MDTPDGLNRKLYCAIFCAESSLVFGFCLSVGVCLFLSQTHILIVLQGVQVSSTQVFFLIS